MDSQLPNTPVATNSTFAISRPNLTRSDTFDKVTPNAPSQQQNVDIGNNLTQNVIIKLQENTFTASNPSRMSISPVALSHQFAAPRHITNSEVSLLASHISSTPFRDTPISKFSTQYLCDQKLLPPISFDITGTESTVASHVMDNVPPQLNVSQNIANTTEPSFLRFANSSPFDDTGLGSTVLGTNKRLNSQMAFTPPQTDDIADTAEPSFFVHCTPLQSRGKFHMLAENMREENLIADTSLGQNLDSTVLKTSEMNSTAEDESTIKSTTMLICLNDESRHENTLVCLVPADKEVMEIDEGANLASCGMLKNSYFHYHHLKNVI